MGNATSEFTDGFHSLRVHKLLFQTLTLVFEVLALQGFLPTPCVFVCD